jgi:outer membrane protein OmpA-like peptidoglycan-associated protein
MKKILFSGLLLMFGATAFAQDLPENPEPGKCYVRCKTPEVWKNQDITIEVSPAYKRIVTHPAEYRTATERVLVSEGKQELVVIPAKYEMRDVTVVTKEASSYLVKVPAKTSTVSETIVVEEASQRLEVVPAQYENRDVTIVVKEATQRIEIVPAQYENRDVTVVSKEASQRLEVIPATYGTETITYRKREYGNSLKVVPAVFGRDSEVIEMKAQSARWEMSEKAPDCESSDPNDCRYWCFKEVPAQYQTVQKTTLSSDASVISTPDCTNNSDGKNCGDATYTKRVLKNQPTTRVISIPEVTTVVKKRVMVTPPSTRVVTIPEVTKTISKRVMVTPPTTRVISIPQKTKTFTKTVTTPETTRTVDVPQTTKIVKKRVMVTPPTTRTVQSDPVYSTIKKTTLVKDAWTEDVAVAAKYKTITKEVLVNKGGLTTWKEVECELLSNTILPINWNLGSATLTSAAKSIIDSRLLPVLKDGTAVALESHTDSRGSKVNNQNLSERRAQAVTNYLISKGVNPSQLTGNGYGESKLTNRCADGVSCTEAQHRANRRTSFRVVNQK